MRLVFLREGGRGDRCSWRGGAGRGVGARNTRSCVVRGAGMFNGWDTEAWVAGEGERARRGRAVRDGRERARVIRREGTETER